MISSEREKVAARNRIILGTTIDILKLLAVQNIAVRGHRDDGNFFLPENGIINPVNDGNFLHMLRVKLQDPEIKKAFTDAGHFTYTSKTVQNELIELMGLMIKEDRVKRVKIAKVWTLLGDESTDRQTRELLVLDLRYIDKENEMYVVREDPFAVVDAYDRAATISGATNVPSTSHLRQEISHDVESDDVEDSDEESNAESETDDPEIKLDGESLSKIILEEVMKVSLNPSNCIGQGYDGASTMSGIHGGTAAHIKRVAPFADYFHCVNHATNLSCSKCVLVPTVRNAHDNMSSTISHFNSSAKRARLLKKHAGRLGLDSGKLLRLCTTRFVERHRSAIRFWNLLPAIIPALSEMQKWSDSESRSKSFSLQVCLLKSEVLVGLICLRNIAAIMQPLTVQLQKRGGDLSRALRLIANTKAILEEKRASCEESFSALFKEVEELAQRLRVTVEKPRLVGKSRYRDNTAANQGPESYFRITVYIPVIDAVLSDFNARFSRHFELATGLNCLLPCLIITKSWNDVKASFAKYESFCPGLEVEAKAEFEIWKRHWTNESNRAAVTRNLPSLFQEPDSQSDAEETDDQDTVPKTAIHVINCCDENVFPNIFTLLKILATLPVSTCEPERMFSKVDRTLTSIRSTMGEERLEGLLLMQAFRSELPETSEVISRYAAVKNRRKDFVL